MLRSHLKSCQYLFSHQKKHHQKVNYSSRQKLQILQKLVPYIIPFVHQNKQITTYLLRSYGYLILSKVCFFGGPMFLKYGINHLQNLSLGDPTFYFLGYGILYMASTFFESLRNIQISKVTSFALTQISTKVYSHMLELGPEFFFSGSQRKKLFSMYKAQNAIEHNIRSLTQYFFPFFLDAGICSFILLFYTDFWTLLVFMSCYSVYTIFTILYSDKRKFHINEQRLSEKRMDFISSETFANYYNVKYFRKQGYEVEKYQNALQTYYQNVKRTQESLGTLNTVQRVIFAVGITFNLIMGSYCVQRGLMSTGDIIMIQTLMLQFLSPLFFLGSTYRNFIDTFVELKELFDTMKKLAEVIEGQKQINNVKGQIIFHNVNFSYSEAVPVLHNLNFKISPGEFVGLVGESGSGKSTILNLIFRLFDPKNGQILLDGLNIKQLKFTFRDQIVFVSQTPYLFNGTVLENLQYGCPSSSIQQIEFYTKTLGLHDVIMQLPEQYHSNVGEKGNKFSGGEKQRISLIRALLKKAPIMLLDQPTSALDFHTEEKVIKMLNEYAGTKLMITHRQNLVRFFDQVIEVKKFSG